MNKIKSNKKSISYKEYKKIVESMEYKGFRISIEDTVKWGGEIIIKYRYEVWCPNWCNSGRSGDKLVFPVRLGYKHNIFDDDYFDERIQITEKELKKQLKQIVEDIISKKLKNINEQKGTDK